jgi:hypothetical protein
MTPVRSAIFVHQPHLRRVQLLEYSGHIRQPIRYGRYQNLPTETMYPSVVCLNAMPAWTSWFLPPTDGEPDHSLIAGKSKPRLAVAVLATETHVAGDLCVVEN